MPTYDYVCDACDHQFELFQSITASPARKCPVCGRLKLRRLIGPGAAIVFKGSGFYQTDYRSESYKKSAEAEKKHRSDGKSSGETSGGNGAKSKRTGKTAQSSNASEG
jgi:putative FmdB family regulatory protein